MKTETNLNYETYKRQAEQYEKFIRKVLKEISTDYLITELKRRKLAKINWVTDKTDIKL